MVNKIVDNFSCKGKRKNKVLKKGLLKEGVECLWSKK